MPLSQLFLLTRPSSFLLLEAYSFLLMTLVHPDLLNLLFFKFLKFVKQLTFYFYFQINLKSLHVIFLFFFRFLNTIRMNWIVVFYFIMEFASISISIISTLNWIFFKKLVSSFIFSVFNFIESTISSTSLIFLLNSLKLLWMSMGR